MKDDKKTYDELNKSLNEQYSIWNDEDKEKIMTAIRRLADDGNIHASFRVSTSRTFDIPDEERLACTVRVVRQFEEEPGEYDPWLLCRIAHEYYKDLQGPNYRSQMEKRLMWLRRAYAVDRPYAAEKILHEYRHCEQHSLDNEYCDFCLEILKDADYFVRNDTYVYGDGSKTVLGTVGDAVNGLIELANRGNSRAQHTIGTMFLNGGFLGKDEDVGRKWIERSKTGNL